VLPIAFDGGAIGSQTIGDDRLGSAMALHCALDEGEGGRLIPRLCDVGFQDLALVIHRPPQVAHLAVDLHVDLVEMPSPVSMSPHPTHPLPADLGGEHRTEPVPPQPHGLMANVDAALEQQILDVPK
jgi:hypothetical protein